MTCLSQFELDDLLLHRQGGSPFVPMHVAGCDLCQKRMLNQRDDQQRFAVVAPRVWRAVVERRAARRQRWRLAILGLPLAFAGVTAAMLLAPRVPVAPLDDSEGRPYLGMKGISSLTIAVRRGDALFTVNRSQTVRAGDALRFIPRAPEGFRYVAIGSRDGRGVFSLFYPPQPEGWSLPLPAPGEALPGSIILDDAPGPERLIMILTDLPLTGEQLRTAASIEGTPAFGRIRSQSCWITLEKEAPITARTPSP